VKASELAYLIASAFFGAAVICEVKERRLVKAASMTAEKAATDGKTQPST
jgi:hypothetical protein